MNMLKKPQRISVHQFVQHVEQLNSYIMQLPCWFYSPSAKPSTIPMNVPFTKADLASHVLWMCPLIWQDHFNLHKKGVNPVDMHSLLMSLEAIECVWTQEKSNTQSNKKASNKGKKGNKRPGTESTARVTKKGCFEKLCNLCRSMGVHILHTTQKIVVDMRKMDQKKRFPCHQKRRKETQYCNKLFCAIEQDFEKAWEGNQETRHQIKEKS